MSFKFLHNNFNVLDLDKSLKFYEEALGLKEVRRKVAGDGSFILVYLGDGQTAHQLELTWLRDRKEPYNLGENEFHLAFEAEDYDAAHKNIRKWAASSTKIRRWAYILLPTPITTGWKSFPNVKFLKRGDSNDRSEKDDCGCQR